MPAKHAISRRDILKLLGFSAAALPIFGYANTFALDHADNAALDALPDTLGLPSHCLWAVTPATNWEREAYPIGNGRQGVMLMGGLGRDILQFNEESLWTGSAEDTGRYQNFGQVEVTLDEELPLLDRQAAVPPAIENYRRALDFTRAIHRTQYQRDGVGFARETFASHADRVVVHELSADQPGQLTGSISLRGAHGEATENQAGWLSIQGQLENSLRYEARVHARVSGGQLTATEQGLRFEAADRVLIRLVAATSYVPDASRGFEGQAPAPRLDAIHDAIEDKTTDELRTRHLDDYQPLYSAFSLRLGPAEEAAARRTTLQRLEHQFENRDDPGFDALALNYARYLLIASSRSDTLPANLQGKWNNLNNPPWRSDYHSDINVQMNYWAAEALGLQDCHRSFFRWLEAVAPVKTVNTAEAFGTRGWTMRHENGIHGGGSWRWNKPGPAWCAQHLWEHWQHARDEAFIEQTALPLMKEMCLFWVDHLKELPNGQLVAPDGFSSEHGPQTDGCAYDHQLIWELYTHTIIFCDILDVEPEFRAVLQDQLDRLLPNKIGSWGQLQEWLLEELDDPNNKHRHLSHLIAVYSGHQFFTPEQPDMLEAARVSLDARGDGGAGWALPWKSCLWSRLGDTERAYQLLQSRYKPVLHTTGQIKQGIDGTMANLLCCVWGVFQIDGAFGHAAAIVEMLVQSHRVTEEGHPIVDILPALPQAWPEGELTGLRVRGAVTIEHLAWQQGRVTALELRASADTTIALSVNNSTHALNLARGEHYTLALP